MTPYWPAVLRPGRKITSDEHDCTTRIQTYKMERVLANIDTDHGDRTPMILRHDVLLVFDAPCQLQSLAGQEHGRTIPLGDIETLGDNLSR